MKRARRRDPAAGSWSVAWRVPLVLVAIVSTYANSLSGPFVLDDQASVVQNATIRDLSVPAVLSPPPDSPVAGRPLVNLSFAINYAAGGLAVAGYHAWNIAVHAICAVLVYLLVRWTLELPAVRGRTGASPAAVALSASLLWAVHPLNSEVVDYLSQRTESMMAALYLLTVYAAARSAAGPRPRMWQTIAVVACIAGAGCKESIATAPVVVALYDRIFLFGSWREIARRRAALYGGLSLCWAALALVIGARGGVAGLSSGVTPWTYLLNQSVMIVRYLRLTVWPEPLVAFYGWPEPLTLADVLPEATLIAVLLAGTVAALVRAPLLGFLAAWFFVTLAPASSVVPIATEVGAERRMYLPLVALVLLAVFGARAAWRVVSKVPRAARASTAIGAASVAGVAVVLAGVTAVRNQEYASALTLARTIADRRPNGVSLHMLGEQLSLAGQDEEAIVPLRRAVDAGNIRAGFQLGVALFNLGRFDEAIARLEVFIRTEGVPRVPRWLEPPRDDLLRARTAMGLALVRKEEWDRAAAQAETVLAVVPRYAEARLVLAHARFGQQRWEDAAREYYLYLGARPTDVQALLNYGVSLVATGRLSEALPVFRRAVELDPANANAQRLLRIAEQDLAQPVP